MVHQGVVLGLTLWNVLFDGLLRIDQPDCDTLVAFAEDVAMVVWVRIKEILLHKTHLELLRVAKWLEVNQLQLAP